MLWVPYMLVAEVVQLALVLPGPEHTCGYADIFAPWGLCSFMGCQRDVPAVMLLDMLVRCSQGLAVVLPDVPGEVLSVPYCMLTQALIQLCPMKRVPHLSCGDPNGREMEEQRAYE